MYVTPCGDNADGGVEVRRRLLGAPKEKRLMSPTLMIVAFWLLFAATHIALSSVKPRPGIVGVIGGGGFLGMYSLVAFATFVPMVSTDFGNKHSGPCSGP